MDFQWMLHWWVLGSLNRTIFLSQNHIGVCVVKSVAYFLVLVYLSIEHSKILANSSIGKFLVTWQNFSPRANYIK
jgi:hypothetical protein